MTSTQPEVFYVTMLWTFAGCMRTVWPVQMISQSQVNVVNTGDSIALECFFTAIQYNMFDYPLLWRKIQRGEESQVNIMGNVNQPFLSTGRYEVSFVSDTEDFRFKLIISDVIQEDSGNYTCEVRGPHSVILSHVTHFLLVRNPIESIRLTDEPDDVGFSTSQSTLRVTDGASAVIRCLVAGGYPPPNVALLIGQRDVTEDFRFLSRANVTGSRGLRLMTYRSERRNERFVARLNDNAMRVQCIGTVPGLKPSTASALLDVLYGPTISCRSKSARVGDTNVNLECEIRSNPRIFALFWIMDDNGTTLAEGEVIDETWTLVMDRPDGVVEAQLYLHRLEPSNFRTYSLVAENSISTASVDIELTEMVADDNVANLFIQQQQQRQRIQHQQHRSPSTGDFAVSTVAAAVGAGSNNISVRSISISGSVKLQSQQKPYGGANRDRSGSVRPGQAAVVNRGFTGGSAPTVLTNHLGDDWLHMTVVWAELMYALRISLNFG